MPKRIDQYVSDYVVFDLETTGVSTKRDSIIEISALKVRGGNIADQFSFLVNPQRKIPIAASSVNHITDSMVENAPLISDILPKFLHFIQDSILLGQNIQRFDLKLLYRDCEKLNLPSPNNDFVDILPISRNLLPQLAHHSLSDLAHHYGVSYKGAHRALTDCYITHAVYQHMQQDKRPVPSSIPMCPKCDAVMVLRNGKYGEFWGCSHYPKCNGTRNIQSAAS